MSEPVERPSPLTIGRRSRAFWPKVAAVFLIMGALAGVVVVIRNVMTPRGEENNGRMTLNDPGTPPSGFQNVSLPAGNTHEEKRDPPAAPPVLDQLAQNRRAALDSGLLLIAPGMGGGGGPAGAGAPGVVPGAGVAAQPDALAQALTPTPLTTVKATEATDPNYTISAGRVIQCRQVTRYDSTAPGGVVGEISDDVWSDTGPQKGVRLIDKGATLVGTSAHGIAMGTDRAFILWQTIKTIPIYDEHGIPHKYDIAVNSPATEQDGANGLPGEVNRHLPMKLGGVFAISVMQGLTGAISNIGSSSNGNTTNIFPSFGQGASSAADIWLHRMIDIPDVLTRLQGQQCAVLVLRDLYIPYRLVRRGAR